MKNNPDRLAIELQQITALATAGNYSEALRLVDVLVQRHAQEGKTWAARAFVHAHQGHQTAAIVDWSKAIQLCEEPHWLYMRGINWFQLANFSEAISDFTKVIELCAVHKSDYYKDSALFFRADAHLRLGEFEQARADCMQLRDDMQTWTDKLRTKADILSECNHR